MKARLDKTTKTGSHSLARACARLLAWNLAFAHAFLRIDWQRFMGSPSMAAGVFLVVPATWLVIREHCLVARFLCAERRARTRVLAWNARLQLNAG